MVLIVAAGSSISSPVRETTATLFGSEFGRVAPEFARLVQVCEVAHLQFETVTRLDSRITAPWWHCGPVSIRLMQRRGGTVVRTEEWSGTQGFRRVYVPRRSSSVAYSNGCETAEPRASFGP